MDTYGYCLASAHLRMLANEPHTAPLSFLLCIGFKPRILTFLSTTIVCGCLLYVTVTGNCTFWIEGHQETVCPLFAKCCTQRPCNHYLLVQTVCTVDVDSPFIIMSTGHGLRHLQPDLAHLQLIFPHKTRLCQAVHAFSILATSIYVYMKSLPKTHSTGMLGGCTVECWAGCCLAVFRT
jgi:hypothetical protein